MLDESWLAWMRRETCQRDVLNLLDDMLHSLLLFSRIVKVPPLIPRQLTLHLDQHVDCFLCKSKKSKFVRLAKKNISEGLSKANIKWSGRSFDIDTSPTSLIISLDYVNISEGQGCTLKMLKLACGDNG